MIIIINKNFKFDQSLMLISFLKIYIYNIYIYILQKSIFLEEFKKINKFIDAMIFLNYSCHQHNNR